MCIRDSHYTSKFAMNKYTSNRTDGAWSLVYRQCHRWEKQVRRRRHGIHGRHIFSKSTVTKMGQVSQTMPLLGVICHPFGKTWYTRGSAMAEALRDALVSRNSATIKYPYRAALFAWSYVYRFLHNTGVSQTHTHRQMDGQIHDNGIYGA